MQEKENVIDILEQSKKAIRKEDVIKLKELSNRTTHTASITKDPDNIAIAVIIYALSKIIERGEHKGKGSHKCSKYCEAVLTSIDGTILAVKENDEKGISRCIENIRKALNKISPKMKSYIKELFTKASINKASKIYEHGISLEKTASLLGITIYDLASYVGQKSSLEESGMGKKIGIKKRLKIAMEAFSWQKNIQKKLKGTQLK